MNDCKICRNETIKMFSAEVLKKYDVGYYQCTICGFLQTEEPYWLQEAYANSITLSDTGILERNLQLSDVVKILLYTSFPKTGKYLDYAGGFGIFTRLMRDIGFDFYWSDPFTQNLVARGFDYTPSISPITAITTFETFEHFVQPLTEIEKMLAISRNIIFSTQLLPEPVPKPDQWWYYVLNHGQHISFYSRTSLEFIAQKYSLYFYSFGIIHVLTEKKLNETLLKMMFRLRYLGINRLIRNNIQSRTFPDFESFRNKE